jgi:hypothetical protein
MLKNLLRVTVFATVTAIIVSCSPKVEVGNVNLENWKKDRNGCLGLRANDIEEFRKVKNSLLGKDNQTLIKTFGRPDKVELTDRSQSFFMYYVDPAPTCGAGVPKDEILKVLIRLNAVSRVSEVTITHLEP